MKIRRTANAGVLIEIDNKTILLDGICGEIPPYLKTPDYIKNEIMGSLPDIVAFTHFHTDHFDSDFVNFFEDRTGKKALSPENSTAIKCKDIEIIPIKTRHIGKALVEHISFIIRDSKTIWFMGDATPITLNSMAQYPKPDVLLVPFAYLNSESSLKLTKGVGAKYIVLLHLPEKENDSYGIYESVQKIIKNEQNIHIINMGETLICD